MTAAAKMIMVVGTTNPSPHEGTSGALCAAGSLTRAPARSQ